MQQTYDYKTTPPPPAVPKPIDPTKNPYGTPTTYAQYPQQQYASPYDAPVDLAATRFNEITSKDNALMQQAKGAALQQMNARGLVNSSLAIGAAQDAAYKAAAPMAIADSNAVNEMYRAGQKYLLDVSKSQLDKQFDAEQAALDRAWKTSERLGQQEWQGLQNNLNREQQMKLLQLDQAFQEKENALRRAQELAMQDKSIAAQQALQRAQQEFAAAQSALDREFQLARDAAQAKQQAELLAKQQQFASAQNELDRQLRLAIQTNDIQAQKEIEALRQQFSAQQADVDRQLKLLMQEKDIGARKSLQEIEQQFQSSESAKTREFQKGIEESRQAFEAQQDATRQTYQQANMAYGEQLRQQTMALSAQLEMGAQERLKAIDQDYALLRGTSSAANSLIGNMNTGISNILNNPDMDETAKQSQINKLIESTEFSLKLIGSINGIDFGDLLDFGGE